MEIEERIDRSLEKSPFRRRPLCLMCAAFLSVTAASFYFGWTAPVALAVWLIWSVYQFIKLKSLGALVPWLLLFSVSSALILSGIYSYERGETLEIAVSNSEMGGVDNVEADSVDDVGDQYNEHVLEALILKEYYCESFGSSYYVRLLGIDGHGVKGHAVIEADQPLNGVPYDVIICNAELSEYSDGAVSPRVSYSRSDDIILLCEVVSDVRFTDSAHRGLSYRAYLLRSWLLDGISRVLPRDSADFASALLFGDTSGLTTAFSRDVTSVGISHVLAVSGQHLSILSYIIVRLMRKARFSARRIAVPTALFALFYAWLCDGSPSIVRAALTVIIGAVVMLFGYRPDPLISLFLATVIICVSSPISVLDVGLILSFLATLGILLSEDILSFRFRSDRAEHNARPRKKPTGAISRLRIYTKRALHGILSCAVTCAAATLLTVPVGVFYFGEISALSVPFNVLISPLVTFELTVGLLLVLFCRVPLMGKLTGTVFYLGHTLIRTAVEGAARRIGGLTSMRYPFVIPLLVICMLGYVSIHICGIRKRAVAFVPLTAFLAAYTVGSLVYGATYARGTEIVTLTYGTNECILIGSEGETLICDISDGSKSIARLAVDTVKEELYTDRIDGYMLTHYHLRHLSAIGELLRIGYIETVYLPTPKDGSEKSLAEDVERLTGRYGCDVSYYSEDGATFGACTVSVKRADVATSTHPALCVLLSSPELSFVYLSPSVCESEMYGDCLELAAKEGCVYLGAHGPSQAHPSSLVQIGKASENNARVFVSAANSRDMYLNGTTALTFDSNGVSVNRFKEKDEE